MPPALSFEDARQTVIDRVQATLPAALPIETVCLADAMNRVLAEDILADRDFPPMDRSARDGYAVRAADLPGRLECIGEVRAGETFAGNVGPGQAVEIMTGAPLPSGADHVVMVEHTIREGNWVVVNQAGRAGENFNARGAEAQMGSVVLRRGQRISVQHVCQAAAVGARRVAVYRRPTVAILATGDEVVDVDTADPTSDQVRNSNSATLAAQVFRIGAVPVVLPIARDTLESTRSLIERGLEEDLLLLSGGVSAGKYDLVETVLEEMGAEFFFTRVRIQPGQPLVFGRVRGKFFFGLPGNPASTMVTFEVFARAAIQILGGQCMPLLPLTQAVLQGSLTQKPGLTRFLPALLDPSGLTPVGWKGSGDIPALARSNCFLVTDPERERYEVGDTIGVLLP